MVAWGYDGWPRSQLLPFWPRQRAPSFSRNKYWHNFPAQQTHSLTRICHVDPLQLGHLRIHCPVNNLFGTISGSKPTVHSLRILLWNRPLASLAPHSGDWLLALTIANCGLQLDDEAVRVTVGMRLSLSLCVPHSCPCGEQVDAQRLHATVCKKAPGRIARHQVLDDIIWRSLGSAGIPATKEPSGLVRQDGKRPD